MDHKKKKGSDELKQMQTQVQKETQIEKVYQARIKDFNALILEQFQKLIEGYQQGDKKKVETADLHLVLHLQNLQTQFYDLEYYGIGKSEHIANLLKKCSDYLLSMAAKIDPSIKSIINKHLHDYETILKGGKVEHHLPVKEWEKSVPEEVMQNVFQCVTHALSKASALKERAMTHPDVSADSLRLTKEEHSFEPDPAKGKYFPTTSMVDVEVYSGDPISDPSKMVGQFWEHIDRTINVIIEANDWPTFSLAVDECLKTLNQRKELSYSDPFKQKTIWEKYQKPLADAKKKAPAISKKIEMILSKLSEADYA